MLEQDAREPIQAFMLYSCSCSPLTHSLVHSLTYHILVLIHSLLSICSLWQVRHLSEEAGWWERRVARARLASMTGGASCSISDVQGSTRPVSGTAPVKHLKMEPHWQERVGSRKAWGRTHGWQGAGCVGKEEEEVRERLLL